MKSRLRQIEFLIVARTMGAECVPMFTTRDRDIAISRAHNLKPGCAQQIVERLHLPAGEITGVAILEMVNGMPGRVENVIRRDYQQNALDASVRSMLGAPHDNAKPLFTTPAFEGELPE